MVDRTPARSIVAGVTEGAPLEREIRSVGRELAAALPSPARHPVKALDGKAMELASADAELRAALFRFVDVVPACRSLDDLAAHLTGYLEDVGSRPPPLEAAMRMAHTRAGRAALGAAAAAGVRHMAHRFILAEDPRGALGALRARWQHGIASTLDLLGEATVTRAEADAYAARCRDALQTLAEAGLGWPARPRLDADGAGPLPRANVCVKVSALTPLLRPEAPARGKRDAGQRLRALLRRARDVGAHLHVDVESLDTREAVHELVLELLAEPEFEAGPSAGLVVQAYLRDSPALVDTVVAWARATPRAAPLTVRLVKGAYWDHEVVEARQHGWSSPVFEVKAQSDANFERLTAVLLEARPALRVAVASHNLRSVANAIALNRAAGLADSELELQVLLGLGDDLAEALAACGHRVRAYCPVGDLVAGMAYLVRRLLENTSNESFLAAQAGGAELEQLLAAPAAATPPGADAPAATPAGRSAAP
jgi:RHH-type proline utilization regulon transcriptional repressor/proline dehydrogenase/delta 1-pyrroline-5-carboxylate dehydrogenase